LGLLYEFLSYDEIDIKQFILGLKNTI